MSMRRAAQEPVVVNRDVRAVIVPAGVEVKLRPGTVGTITQALGGSYTVYVEGNLFRIAGVDGDAIGKEPIQPPALPAGASDEDVNRVVWDQLRTCFDPEIPINIVDLGLVYDCKVTHNDDGTRDVAVKMTLTAPGCGMGEVLVADVRDKLKLIPTIRNADVELVFDPPVEPVDDVGSSAPANRDDVTMKGRRPFSARYAPIRRSGPPCQLSPSDSSVALPPTAAVLMVTVCSVAKRGR